MLTYYYGPNPNSDLAESVGKKQRSRMPDG